MTLFDSNSLNNREKRFPSMFGGNGSRRKRAILTSPDPPFAGNSLITFPCSRSAVLSLFSISNPTRSCFPSDFSNGNRATASSAEKINGGAVSAQRKLTLGWYD
jgi:hypothetical protein